MNPVNGAASYIISLPAAALGSAAEGQTLEIRTAFGTVIFPGGVLSGEQAKPGETAVLKIAKADLAGQSSGIIKAVGARPAVELSLSISGKEASWQQNTAPVQVSIPYEPSAAEILNTEYLAVWHIDEKGVSHPVTRAKYDPATAAVTFSTRHFSIYAVAMNRYSFADLGPSHWAYKPVGILAAQGILNGVSADSFAPSVQISRADYLLMLLCALGLESTESGSAGYPDVQPDSYYYDAVSAAQALGIAGGRADGSFAPAAPITRQEMIVMADRALTAAGIQAASLSSRPDRGIRDLDAVADYAADAVNRMLEAGWIQGNNGMINPEGTASRAEAAVLLYNIYSRLQ